MASGLIDIGHPAGPNLFDNFIAFLKVGSRFQHELTPLPLGLTRTTEMLSLPPLALARSTRIWAADSKEGAFFTIFSRRSFSIILDRPSEHKRMVCPVFTSVSKKSIATRGDVPTALVIMFLFLQYSRLPRTILPEAIISST